MEHQPDNTFAKGMAATLRGRYLEALALFEASMELTHRGGDEPSMTCLSYYGLCVAMAGVRSGEAREICDAAVAGEPDNPDLHLNLGRVNLAIGNRADAFNNFIGGLRIDRRHPGLISALQRMGFRRRPVLGFLGRHHPLNRLLGRVRAGRQGDRMSSALARL